MQIDPNLLLNVVVAIGAFIAGYYVGRGSLARAPETDDAQTETTTREINPELMPEASPTRADLEPPRRRAPPPASAGPNGDDGGSPPPRRPQGSPPRTPGARKPPASA